MLGVEYFDVLDVVALEGEAGEVSRVGLDEMFGDRIEFSHDLCLGLRVSWYPQQGKNRARGAAQRGGEGWEGVECSGKVTGVGSWVTKAAYRPLNIKQAATVELWRAYQPPPAGSIWVGPADRRMRA